MRSDRVIFVYNPARKFLAPLLVTLAISTLMAGCSNSKLRRTPEAERPTPWFCEMNEARDDWDCVQDEALARKPKPKRLPSDPVEPNPFDEEEALTRTDTDGLSDVANPSAAIDFEALALVQIQSDVSRVMSLPPEHFTVQLTTTETKPLADGFISENELKEIEELMTLKLASEGTPYYVVLLGLYETEEAAQAAAEARPDSLADIKPWIRPLGAIQAGITAAASSR